MCMILLDIMARMTWTLLRSEYQKISIIRTEKGLPNGEQAYPIIIQQLVSEIQDYLRVDDKIGFFVFKRPTMTTVSPHIQARPFAESILKGTVGNSVKNDMIDAVKEWKARMGSEYGIDNRRYFGRKHIWLVKRKSLTSIKTIQNPVTVDDGRGGVKREYIDINEECNEGA